jgi:hypothetical protein
MTLAIDGAGVYHAAVATVVDTSGQYMVVYARCPGNCNVGSSWSAVALLPGGVGEPPTIALTADGRPRIAYYVDITAQPGPHYLECDASCLSPRNWRDVRLSNHFAVSVVPRPRLPFAVSAGGSAAFAYDDGTGLQLFLCTSNCGNGASWTQGTIATVYIVPESLAFGSDQSLQIATRQRATNTETLLFLDCPSNCTSPQSWSGVNLWTATGETQALIVRTAQGGTRLALYSDNPTTSDPQRVFVWIACDGQCGVPANWKPPLLPPLAPAAADIGYSLALDGSGNPVLAYASLTSSAISRCTGDCTTTSGIWSTVPGLTSDDLDAAFPVLPPASCVSGAWQFYTGPALALGAGGKPQVALTASSKAFGGQCGTGSASIETDSFLFSPP